MGKQPAPRRDSTDMPIALHAAHEIRWPEYRAGAGAKLT